MYFFFFIISCSILMKSVLYDSDSDSNSNFKHQVGKNQHKIIKKRSSHHNFLFHIHLFSSCKIKIFFIHAYIPKFVPITIINGTASSGIYVMAMAVNEKKRINVIVLSKGKEDKVEHNALADIIRITVMSHV